MKIGDYVKQYRKNHGLSMQAFGDQCGLSRAYISILEKGINPTTGKSFTPTLETLNKIARASNTTLDVLLEILDDSQSVLLNHESHGSDDNYSPEYLDEAGKKIIALYGQMNNEQKKAALQYIEFVIDRDSKAVENKD